MICSSCLRNVPDLIGPQHDLCPACYGIDADDYMPSLHEPWCEESHDPALLSLAEPWYLEDLLDGLEADLAADLTDGETLADPPRFHGRRRF